MCCFYYRGGNIISQTPETAKDDSSYTCPNASCRKIFTRPLKAVTAGGSAEPYDACPYCLTEITSNAKTILTEPQKNEDPMKVDQQKQDETVSSPAGCTKHFGYLGERAAKEQIPDDCLTCKDIVQCMVKKAKE